MGKPIKINDIARKLIESSGLKIGKDIDIAYTGLRPGEKLHEDLYWKGENISQTSNRKIKVLKNGMLQQDYLISQIDRLEYEMSQPNLRNLLEIFQKLVPEGRFADSKTSIQPATATFKEAV